MEQLVILCIIAFIQMLYGAYKQDDALLISPGIVALMIVFMVTTGQVDNAITIGLFVLSGTVLFSLCNHVKSSNLRFWSLIIICLLVVLTEILFYNYTLMVMSALLIVNMILHHYKKPRKIAGA